ncbi:MAG: flagellar biosynthesis protein FliQ [Cyanobacteriota bacterium]
MSEAVFLELIQDTLITIITLSMPVLIVSLGVGLIISLFQAVTQIQEATLTFVPKIIMSLITLSVLGPWMLSIFMTFVNDLYNTLENFM